MAMALLSCKQQPSPVLNKFFRPFMNYVNHVSKVVNSRTAIITHQGGSIENFKEKLDL